MTKEEFCKAYTEIYGEPLTDLNQLTQQTFTGQELFEFVNDILDYHLKPLKVMTTSDIVEIQAMLKELAGKRNCIAVLPAVAEFKPFSEQKETMVESIELINPHFEESPIGIKSKHQPKGHERPYKYHR